LRIKEVGVPEKCVHLPGKENSLIRKPVHEIRGKRRRISAGIIIKRKERGRERTDVRALRITEKGQSLGSRSGEKEEENVS